MFVYGKILINYGHYTRLPQANHSRMDWRAVSITKHAITGSAGAYKWITVTESGSNSRRKYIQHLIPMDIVHRTSTCEIKFPKHVKSTLPFEDTI